jgi:cell division protein ZapA
MPDPRIIPVEILGQHYPVSTALEPEYVAKLAAIVDERMRHAVELTPSGEPLQLAVLAALNIADELVRCREARTLSSDHIAERAGELERLLDRVLMA